ncbi:MAG: 30S ribosomal protein S19e [Zestosphaera tikiterensis]|uniref:Small ribosomal subunit protein eS19 n=1 Tax=Zestosphaera tikiterensis TaxID=1973259 RepID=A0A2R7Y773_9CREN|nr:MAG: 30S ribosomal protein S19e [Zestosphaera tikiterensis]
MVNVKEVPADLFIAELARYLKENVKTVKPPAWASYVKTGSFREKIPEDPEWWYVRAASVLRKLYISGEPIGLNTLRVVYGGLKRRGSAPPHFRRAGGAILRTILHQLESAGLVTKVEKKGRVLTPKGYSLLDSIADKVFKEVVAVNPELKRYGG